jgi:hypothetical protein
VLVPSNKIGSAAQPEGLELRAARKLATTEAFDHKNHPSFAPPRRSRAGALPIDAAVRSSVA